jgi:hypothetical protein
MLIWWTKSADATNGVATVSQSNVPSGTYDIRIDGDAADGTSYVDLRITASSTITCDSQGRFEYKYASSGVPPGAFTLQIGGITRTVTLLASLPTPTPTPVSTSPARPLSGGGGGGGDVTPTPISTQTIAPTTSPTPTPIETPEREATQETTSEEISPGFEFISGIVGLFAVAFFVSRRRK